MIPTKTPGDRKPPTGSETGSLIRESLLRDMAEGVLSIGLDGKISFLNPAASDLLGIPEDRLLGKPFAASFFEYEENEAFTQLILDAIYDPASRHEAIVPYFTGSLLRQLHVTTSFLSENGRRVAVIAVLNDMSELVELRDAVRAMERIRSLNAQLELRNQLLSTTFGRFLSDEIVRQLLETPDGLALGGKKREVTILMSDLRGFTAMSERMPPHDLLTMLNHYLGEMTEVIQSNSGTIIEFIGDGIMALFGAPIEVGNHAEAAVAAAVGMEARMEQVNAWNREHGYPELQMGIGVNSGDVIVGNIGSEKRTKYGVVGSHVNLAGRIESYTVGGQILIAPYTRSLIRAELTVAQEQQIYPKGVATPLTISHVTGIGAPYNVTCTVTEVEPTVLPQPVAVTFLPIREKHVGAENLPGEFLTLSATGGDLRTSEPLEAFENIQIDLSTPANPTETSSVGGKLFAKVLTVKDGVCRVRFTSTPPSFPAWLAAVGS